MNSDKKIRHGTLASVLDLAGNATTKPKSHVAFFAGDYPCHKDGREIAQIRNSSSQRKLAEGLVVDHRFSSKPTTGKYEDYYAKMSTYAAIISGPAESIDPSVTPKSPVVEPGENESVFNYIDTASSRAGISAVTQKLQLSKVGIVGLGGTGSYILDLVAKTPVEEIHLFDKDKFLQHNAFRSPGAPSVGELREKPQKVAYMKKVYSKMHRGIVAHYSFVDSSNVDCLEAMDFVFMSLDKGEAKSAIMESLEDFEIPFIDVGMGVDLDGGSLGGMLRVTTSTPAQRDHVQHRVPLSGGDGDDDYSENIQIADLNALNAALAVVKWKKLSGFYRDLDDEHHSTYTLDGNSILNEDRL